MSYMKLIKLLYLADREALLRWGRPVSTDCYVSMGRGPVLSQALNLINEGSGPGVDGPWSKLISPPENRDVRLLVENPPKGELSKAEEELIDEIFRLFGHMDTWKLVEHLQTLPEWTDPGGSALLISYGAILSYGSILGAGGKSEEEIAEIEQELESLEAAQLLV